MESSDSIHFCKSSESALPSSGSVEGRPLLIAFKDLLCKMNSILLSDCQRTASKLVLPEDNSYCCQASIMQDCNFSKDFSKARDRSMYKSGLILSRLSLADGFVTFSQSKAFYGDFLRDCFVGMFVKEANQGETSVTVESEKNVEVNPDIELECEEKLLIETLGQNDIMAQDEEMVHQSYSSAGQKNDTLPSEVVPQLEKNLTSEVPCHSSNSIDRTRTTSDRSHRKRKCKKATPDHFRISKMATCFSSPDKLPDFTMLYRKWIENEATSEREIDDDWRSTDDETDMSGSVSDTSDDWSCSDDEMEITCSSSNSIDRCELSNVNNVDVPTCKDSKKITESEDDGCSKSYSSFFVSPSEFDSSDSDSENETDDSDGDWDSTDGMEHSSPDMTDDIFCGGLYFPTLMASTVKGDELIGNKSPLGDSESPDESASQDDEGDNQVVFHECDDDDNDALRTINLKWFNFYSPEEEQASPRKSTNISVSTKSLIFLILNRI